MSEQRTKVAQLQFKCERYDGPSVDAAALEEMIQFQKIVTETAKAIWRRENPDRKRLPQNFEERTQLRFRPLESGSAIVPIEIPNTSKQLPILEEPNLTVEAIDLVYGAFDAANRDALMPKGLPKEILPDLAKFGTRLPDDAELSFALHGGDVTPVSPNTRKRLSDLVEHPYEDAIEVIGRVLEADVRNRRFQIWFDDGTNVVAGYSLEQESKITSALKDHDTVRLKLKGRGEFSPTGTMEKIISVENIDSIEGEDFEFDPNAPNIVEKITSIFKSVSDEEWAKVPTDLSARHDFYLYGKGDE